MKAWSGSTFPLILLGTLAGLTYWLKQAVELPVEGRPDGKLRHDPDMIIEKFRAATVDAQGKPLHYFEAEKLVHYPDDDTSEILRPRLRYTPSGQSEMRISAEKGHTKGKQDEVQLTEQVRVERLPTRETQGWVATMAELTAYPDAGLAKSDSPYVVTQGAAQLEGIGFHADKNAQILELHQKVRGTFPPRKPEHKTP